jgi:hypothetical protein
MVSSGQGKGLKHPFLVELLAIVLPVIVSLTPVLIFPTRVQHLTITMIR